MSVEVISNKSAPWLVMSGMHTTFGWILIRNFVISFPSAISSSFLLVACRSLVLVSAELSSKLPVLASAVANKCTFVVSS